MAEFEVNSVQEAQDKLKEIDPEGKLNKPTPEETKQFYEDFAKSVSDFNNKVYEISVPEKMNTIASYLLDFIERKVFWTKQGWMGVIKLNEEIKETQRLSEGRPFTLSYQAMEFTYYALVNVGGIGLETALEMEKNAQLYAEIVEEIGNKLEAARNELKDIQFLQDKWAAAEQGFYLERETEIEVSEQTQTIEIPNETPNEVSEPPTVSPD